MMEKMYNKYDFLSNEGNYAFKDLVNNLFPICMGIAERYCKNNASVYECAKQCFLNTIYEILQEDSEEFSNEVLLKKFKICLTKKIIFQREGERIADTTTVVSAIKKESNLFSASEYYKNYTIEELLTHLRNLNPLQQVIYNLIIIDEFTPTEVANIIEHSELSVKFMLEKAIYNLHTSIKSSI